MTVKTTWVVEPEKIDWSRGFVIVRSADGKHIYARYKMENGVPSEVAVSGSGKYRVKDLSEEMKEEILREIGKLQAQADAGMREGYAWKPWWAEGSNRRGD